MSIYEPHHDIVEVEVIGDYKLRLTFDDGMVREVDMSGRLWRGVFEPLKDPALFAQVRIDLESGTICWPTGANPDPVVLHQGLPPLYSVEVEPAGSRTDYYRHRSWHKIVAVEIVGDYRLHLTFDDGMVRELDMADQLWGEVFEPLKDPELFAQVKIDPEMGYLFWPTGADLNNIALYQGRPPLCSVEVARARAPGRAA